MARRVPESACAGRSQGVTLVELLVAMAVGLVVVLVAATAFIGSQRLFMADADAQAVEDSLRFASFVIKSVVRQAGYADHADHADFAPDQPGTDGLAEGAGGANLPAGVSNDLSELDILGASNTRVSGTGDSHGAHGTGGVNGSDSLRVRFFGRSSPGGDGTEPDGTMIDCMGFAQPGPVSGGSRRAARAWSFFYVAKASDKEPELYCKYRAGSNGAFSAQPLARGIEVFKVVYGRDADGDSVPEQWLDAAKLEAMAASGAGAADPWRQVVGLRIGMVARSARARGEAVPEDNVLHPLGPEFADVRFTAPADGRVRRTMTFTVMLRNAMKDPVQ